MGNNADLSQKFSMMADVLELLGENPFKVSAFRRGARVLGELSQDVGDICQDIKNLTAIEGIGKGLAEKIIEHCRTGHVKEIDEAVAKVPPGVLEIMKVPGVGPKTADKLWKQANITTLEQLKSACSSGELAKIKGMGEKTCERISKSLTFHESGVGRTRIDVALPLAETIIRLMKKAAGVEQIDYAGSLRRGQETIGDIDIIVGCDDPESQGEAIGQHFRGLPMVAEVIAAGPTKSSVRIAGNIQVDLRVVRSDRYGAALLYFTGSKAHNVALRGRAEKMKLRLNEYGLWHAEDFTKETLKNPDARPVAAKSEAEVYKKLKLAHIEPELREDRGEVDAAESGNLPQLITVDDIRAELHAHSTASDGVWSIEEFAAIAKARGYHTIAITDHSKGQPQANGLTAERLLKHIQHIHEIRKQIDGIQILAGTEVDILPDGRLDYDDELLAQLDIVVASPHSALKQEPDEATKRLIRAIENPYVHIIGHPTGRLVGRREGISPDMNAVIKAAAATGTVLEINANPARLDLRDTHARAAIEAGVKLAINTDAHGEGDLTMLPYGIRTARRAWVEPQHVINCLPPEKIKTWLKAKRKKMGV